MGLQLVEVERIPDFRSFRYARIGAFALSTYNLRYVPTENLYDYNNTRDTISVHYREAIRDIRFFKKNAPSYPLSYPYFAFPIVLPSSAYIDMRGAFQQIALSYGYEVWYKEGKAFSYGTTLPDFPFLSEVKVSRGLLITAHAEKARYTEWKDGRLTTKSFPNQQYAPYLRYAIWRTLHSLMNAVKPYVFYCHTDGIIVNTAFLHRVEKIWDAYHVKYAIKSSGRGVIRGVGSYDVGELRTRNLSCGGYRDNIITDDLDSWWLDKFVKGIERRNLS